MPCTRTGSLHGDEMLAKDEEIEEVQAEVLRLTQMLCAVCRRCEEHGVPVPKIAAGWWRRHKAQDDRSTR